MAKLDGGRDDDDDDEFMNSEVYKKLSEFVYDADNINLENICQVLLKFSEIKNIVICIKIVVVVKLDVNDMTGLCTQKF